MGTQGRQIIIDMRRQLPVPRAGVAANMAARFTWGARPERAGWQAPPPRRYLDAAPLGRGASGHLQLADGIHRPPETVLP